MADQPLRIGILDNDHLSSERLAEIMLHHFAPVKVLWRCRQAEAALKKCERHDKRPTAMLVDLKLDGMSGVEYAAQMRRRYPRVALVGITSYTVDMSEPWRLHLDALLSKECELMELIHALGEATKREDIKTWIDEYEHPPLTDLELEILSGYGDGKATHVIAKELNITKNTVKTHLHTILKKLDKPTRASAVLKCAREGLL